VRTSFAALTAYRGWPLLVMVLLVACAPAAVAPTANPPAIAAAQTPTPPSSPPTATPMPTPAESAEAFWTRLLPAQGRGEWAAIWDTLHPAHQAVVTKERFVSCSDLNKWTGTTEMKVLSTREELFGPPEAGLQPPTLTTALTIQASFDGDAPELLTDHAWNLGGRWRWALHQPSYEAFRKGVCPD